MISSSDSPSTAAAGARRVGRYVIFEEFARGGMASIHFGRIAGAAGFSRVVAVKRVRALFVDSDEHRRAIVSEARIASRIRHPNVVQTLDIVVDEGIAHVVMEYVHGVTVAELFAESKLRGERVPVGIAVGVVADALQGLHAAHEARDAGGDPLGIVHRDVSPQNIQVGVDGLARLLDFGIAKAIGRTQVTAPGVVKGKIAYMAREQLGGAPATRQADVYAAGVVLWELLAGERLFDEGDPALLATRVLTEAVRPPSERAPEVSPALDQVVLRATSPDPKQRYENAAEMLAALTSSTPRETPAAIGAWVERLAGDELELRAERVKRAESVDIGEVIARPEASPRRRLLATSAVVGVALVVGGAFAATRPRPISPPITSTPTSTPTPTPTSTPTPTATATATPTPTPTPTPPPRPPKRRPSPSCDPPFRIDSSGTKLYKPECLR